MYSGEEWISSFDVRPGMLTGLCFDVDNDEEQAVRAEVGLVMLAFGRASSQSLQYGW